MGSRPRKTTTTRRREKREERRAKSEERRERREERREKKEERRDPKRGRQRSPNEAARGGPTLFLAMPPGAGTSGGLKGRGKRAEKRKKREETPKEAARGPQMRPPEGGQPFYWPCRPLLGPLAASRAERREQRKERREKRKERKWIFAVFREVRKGCYSRMPLNFRVQMARGGGLRAKKGDVHCAAWPTDPQKTSDFRRKTSIFGKPLFCIQRWLGSCLETSSGRLGATPTGPGGESPRLKKSL